MKDWKDTLAAVAPALATALGGPLAGAITQQVSSALLGHANGSEAELAAALASPDAAIKLRELENAAVAEQNRHLETLAAQATTAATDAYKVDASDRDSARQREIAVKDHTPTVLAYLTTSLVAFVAASMIFVAAPAANSSVLYLVVGQIIGGWLMALTYYFGSTARSGEKDRMLFAAQSRPGQ